MKHAHILLFPKPDKDQTNPNNYRPISLTCTISKLLEKIIVNRIHKHLSHIIIPNSQAGFRPGLNTKHQLMRVLTPIEQAFHRRFTPVLVALDIQKAFDTVWHDGIRYKLSRMPISNTITRWISSFLRNRTGQIKHDNTLSHTFNIQAGTPQGSVLSPLLYILFSSDIPQPLDPRTGIAQYADDVAYWAAYPHFKQSVKKVQQNITLFTTWANKWRVTINATKTQACAFKKRNLPGRILQQKVITINHTNTHFTKHITYLGLVMDHKFKWTPTAQKLYNKMKMSLRFINFLSGFRTLGCYPPTLKLLYTTYTRSLTAHTSIVFPNFSNTQKEKIRRIESSTLRRIYKPHRYYRNTQLYTDINFTPLLEHIQNINTRFIQHQNTRQYLNHIFTNPPNTQGFTTFEKLQ